MKKNQDSLIPENWKKIAKKDWERAKRDLKEGDIEASAFWLQQSIEKYLKAFLLRHGWKLRKIHELHELLNDAISYNHALEEFRGLCERVSGYYLIERYPLPISAELTAEDIIKDLDLAIKLIKMLFPEEELK